MSILRDLSFEEYSKMSDREKKELERKLQEDTEKLKLLQKREEEKESEKRLTELELKFEKRILESEQDADFKIRKYENFSILNYKDILNPYGIKEKKYIAFFADNDLSEIEEYGLNSLIIDSYEVYTNFDINLKIYRGRYNKELDKITPDNYSENTLNYKDSIYRVSKKIKGYQSIELQNNARVYYLYVEQQSRVNKSKAWKLTHPRKFDVHIFR